MRFVLRMIAFPFAALCTVLAAVVGLVSGISEVLLELLGGLCLLCALFAWFIQGSGSNGLLLLGIAVFFVALGLLAFLCLMTGLAPQLPLILVAPVASACFNTLGGELLVFQSVMVPWECYVIVPVFGALLPVFFRKSPVKAGLASVLVLLVTALLVATQGTHLDTLSYCFALIVPLVGALNMIYALGYMSHSHTQWRFYAAFTAMCGGLIGMVSSTYLFSFFLFNVLGAGFIFVGVCVIGPAAPLSAVAALRPDGLLAVLPPWAAWVGMALLAVGFVMKAAQLPFRIDWQMHPALAPTPVSGYISSVLLKSAVIGLIKLFMLIGGGDAGRTLLREIAGSSRLHGRVCCIIDDNPDKKGKYIDNIQIVGGRGQILEAAARKRITQIIFAIPTAAADQKREILDICQKTGCRIRDAIEEIAVASPTTYARYCGHPQGVIYGYETADWDSLMPRMMMMKEDAQLFPNLRFAGGWAMRSSGYSSSYVSGDLSGRQTVGDLKREVK